MVLLQQVRLLDRTPARLLHRRQEGSDVSFKEELEELINKHSLENKSNTPDWVLADYLLDCLLSYEVAIQARDAFHTTAAAKEKP